MPAASQLTALLDDSATTGVTIPLNSGVDDHGVDWRMGKLEGWDSPDLDEGADTKSGADGLWDTENFFGGRTLTVGGILTAPTYEAREAAEYRLRQAVTRNRLIQFTVGETTPRWVWARRSGRLMIGPLNDVSSEYSISLLAPDPLKYGGPQVAEVLTVPVPGGGLAPPWTPPILIPASTSGPSQAVFTNAGIYATPPVITIYGPGSGISIYNYATGLQLAYDLTLGATNYLTVDVAKGVALLNGTAQRPPMVGSCVTSTFVVIPGDNVLQIFGTLTAATPPSADIRFYSAWT